MTKTKDKVEEKIDIGKEVCVDRGMLGTWYGKIVELHPYGWAMGCDYYGVIETLSGETHAFDTCIHKLTISSTP
jgi:hypothetical protein